MDYQFVFEADFEISRHLNHQAEKACERVEDVLGLEVRGLRIKVGRTREDIEKMVGQHLPPMMKAVFLAGQHAILITSPENSAEAYVMISHELTHLLTVEIPNIQGLSIPPWYFEGLAEYVSEQDKLRKELGRDSLDKSAQQFAKNGKWIEYDEDKDLAWWMSGSASREEMGLIFSQGYSLVNWLAQKQETIPKEIHRQLTDGKRFPQAIKTATGHQITDIIEAWKINRF